jgi:hypothetical protein
MVMVLAAACGGGGSSDADAAGGADGAPGPDGAQDDDGGQPESDAGGKVAGLVLDHASYGGGSDRDTVRGMVIAANGDIILAGETQSPPTSRAARRRWGATRS